MQIPQPLDCSFDQTPMGRNMQKRGIETAIAAAALTYPARIREEGTSCEGLLSAQIERLGA